MTTGNKIMWKRGEIAPQEQFLPFSTLFYIYISNFRSQITYSFVKCGCFQFIVFLTLSTLICQSMDISKCFSESLGIRDNESRLYLSMAIKCIYLLLFSFMLGIVAFFFMLGIVALSFMLGIVAFSFMLGTVANHKWKFVLYKMAV